jgi:SAM-dependent methyltransferase
MTSPHGIEIETLRALLKHKVETGQFPSVFIAEALPAEIFYNVRARLDPSCIPPRTLYSLQVHEPHRKRFLELANTAYFQRLAAFIEENHRRLFEQPLYWLDIGCADGERSHLFYEKLRDLVPEVRLMAIDISPQMVEQARYVLPQAEIMVADIAQLRIERCLDIVTGLYAVFGHLAPQGLVAAFRNLVGALRPEGLLLFDVQAWDDAYLTHRGYQQGINDDNPCYEVYYAWLGRQPICDEAGNPVLGSNRLFRESELHELLSNAGFRTVAIEQIRTTADDHTGDFGLHYLVAASP